VSDQDEVELCIDRDAFSVPLLATPPAPTLQSRSQQTIIIRLSETPTTATHTKYQLRLCKLSQRDRKSGGGPDSEFRPSTEMEDAKWQLLDPTSADGLTTTIGGIFACYALVRVLHVPSGDAGEWSEVLFVPPANSSKRRMKVEDESPPPPSPASLLEADTPPPQNRTFVDSAPRLRRAIETGQHEVSSNAWARSSFGRF
jgi:hypothetical protein